VISEAADNGGAAPLLRGAIASTGDPMWPLSCTLSFTDPEPLREVVGEVGKHLKIIGRALGVRVKQRGDRLIVSGADGSVSLAATAIEQLTGVALTGYHLRPADVDQACRLICQHPDVELAALYRDAISVGMGKKRVHPRSIRQRQYLHAMSDFELVFGIGPAGTGKTFLAMAMALSALTRGTVRRIILCRPAVEAGEKLGFLPGDMMEKVNPYLRPLYDALQELAGYDRAQRLVAKGVIEVAPLAFMRGRTLSEAFVILDEAQNTTPEQMKMFLTRFGIGSRVVVTGDVTQIDLPPERASGLVECLKILSDVEGINVVHFSDVDVVRHPLVSAIVRAYERASKKANDPRRGPASRSGEPSARAPDDH